MKNKNIKEHSILEEAKSLMVLYSKVGDAKVVENVSDALGVYEVLEKNEKEVLNTYGIKTSSKAHKYINFLAIVSLTSSLSLSYLAVMDRNIVVSALAIVAGQMSIIWTDLAKSEINNERKKFLLEKLKEEMRKVYGILENSKDPTMNIPTEFDKEIEEEQRLIKR